MKKIMVSMFVAVLFGAASVLMIVGVSGGTSVAAHEGKTVAQAQEETNEQAAQKTMVYHYVAQPGDSYSVMARKAVQTYGKKYDVKLSLAGIIYAETHLTQESDSPILEVGQEVDFNERTVKQWVDKAQNLSDQAEVAWSYYAQFANFNTDNVGESR